MDFSCRLIVETRLKLFFLLLLILILQFLWIIISDAFHFIVFNGSNIHPLTSRVIIYDIWIFPKKNLTCNQRCGNAWLTLFSHSFGWRKEYGFSEVAMIQWRWSQKTSFTSGCWCTNSSVLDFRLNTKNDVNIRLDNAMLMHGTQTVLNMAQCDGFFLNNVSNESFVYIWIFDTI